MENGEVVEVVTLPSDVVRWSVVPVDLENATNIGDAVDCIREAIESAVTLAEDRLLACRIRLQGRTEDHGQLLAAEDQLLAEARSIALGLGSDKAWVEKVVIATEPVIDPEILAGSEDAVGDLQRMLQEASSDSDLLHKLKTDIDGMIRRLPHEVRTDVEDRMLKAAVDGDHAALIAEVIPYLSARLIARED